MRRIVTAAMLTAMSVVIGIFCKNMLNFGQGLLRITFENIPILLSGIMYGPAVGGMVGLASDLTSYFLSSQVYPINPIVTFGAFSIGLVSGFFSHYVFRKKGYLRLILPSAIAHIIGSMIIKPIGLFQFYSWGVLYRIPLYFLIAPVEIILLCLIYENGEVRKYIDEGLKEKKKEVSTMNYSEALEYIHSVNWVFCKPGLERICELCKRLGDPQKSLKFIHVAGTNGKGSFCAMTESVLREQGYKVGLYTSPYIVEFNERIKVDGESISNRDLCSLAEELKAITDGMEDKPTEFELITAMAFLHFAREKCDYVVLECGLGGRLDATNIISSPVLSVITGIALDHTAILGDTKEKIAFEKAGIIKEGVPVLWCGNHEGAKEVIEAVAKERSSRFYTVDRSSLVIKEMTLEGTVFDFGAYESIKIPLLGTYQPQNALNVLRAVDILRERGIEIDDSAVCKGLEKVKWQARFEVINSSPLIIADGGHNPEGIDGAIDSVKQYFPEGNVCMISGVMADKDYRYMAGKMADVAAFAVCLTPDNPRALAAEEYAEVFRGLGVEAEAKESVKEAVERAVEWAKEKERPIVCLGSLYMYGEIVGALREILK